jgi:hypothetical protein
MYRVVMAMVLNHEAQPISQLCHALEEIRLLRYNAV